jgi:hypothetical protein
VLGAKQPSTRARRHREHRHHAHRTRRRESPAKSDAPFPLELTAPEPARVDGLVVFASQGFLTSGF